MSSRPSKRQRKEQPPSWLENESLACVASPSGRIIHTKVASVKDKEVFLDRLKKEIIRPFFGFQKGKNKRKNVQVPAALLNHPNKDQKGQQAQKLANDAILKRRIVMGTNECTRALENSTSGKVPRPSLIVLARDIYPPTILAHVPVLAASHSKSPDSSVPILLLPGKASKELGDLFGTKHVSVLLFLPKNSTAKDITMAGGDNDDNAVDKEEELEVGASSSITSFVKFVKHALL
jgi:ribosomal protein L7Ae-like RNA K-turn-binding protein